MAVARIIIIGASGVIGGALYQVARSIRMEVIGTALMHMRYGFVPYDMRTVSIRDAIPDLNKNDVVVLLAGYISPAWIYLNQAEAWMLNLYASKRLVDDAECAGARIVFLSTDQVFDGKYGDYEEADMPHPLNLYGLMKATMESHVLATAKGVVARTGWNVPWVQGQHCPVAQCYETLLKPNAKMATDNFFNVSDVNDTARELLRLAMYEPTQRIHHLVSRPGISRAELARTIKARSFIGKNMAFEEVPFSEIAYSEPRPKLAYLRQSKHCNGAFALPSSVIARKIDRLDGWRFAYNFRGRLPKRHAAV